jgi:hypothetical protein
MTYAIRNHNGRLLGYHPTKRAAEQEARFYRTQTGNPAYIEKEPTRPASIIDRELTRLFKGAK